jgi:hypothetical protein
MTVFITAAICVAWFSQAGGEAGVYAPLLAERYHGVPASQMVVKDTAAAMPTLQGSSSEWLKQFEAIPSELQRLASRPSPTQPHRFDESLFPDRTRLVSAATIEAIFGERGIAENWSAFKTQIDARGYIAFSDALFATDQVNALVYYEARCGGLCGEGGYAWLRRDAVGSPWRVVKKIVGWMS